MTTKHCTAKWPYIVNAVSPVVQNHGENVTFVGFTGAIARSCRLLHSFNVQPCISEIVNCADITLSVFCFPVSTVLAMSAVFCSGLLTWSADNLCSLQ